MSLKILREWMIIFRRDELIHDLNQLDLTEIISLSTVEIKGNLDRHVLFFLTHDYFNEDL